MEDYKFEELSPSIELFGNKIISELIDSDGNHTVRWQHNWQTSLRSRYNNFKSELKNNHTRNPAESLIDRHKIAASLMHAIAHMQPLEVKSQAKRTPRQITMNCWLALYSGVFVVCRFAIEDAIEEKNEKLVDSLSTTSMQFPKAINHDGTYVDQTIRALNESRVGSRFDPFLLANIMFLLDIYHRHLASAQRDL